MSTQYETVALCPSALMATSETATLTGVLALCPLLFMSAASLVSCCWRLPVLTVGTLLVS